MERTPNETTKESSLLAQPLIALVRLCVRNPIRVLVLSMALAAFSVYLSVEHLGFKMSRLDLINPNSSFNRLWLEYIEEFGESDEVILVVEGKGNVEVIPVLDELAKKVAAHPTLFQGVLHGVDLSRIRCKGLHYVPAKELAVIDQFAAESVQITAGNWNQLGVGTMLDGLAYRLQNVRDPESMIRTLHELDQFSLSLSKAYAPSPSYGSPWPQIQMQGIAQMPDVVAACSQNNTSYFLFPTKNGVIGFVLLKLAKIDKTAFAQGNEAIAKLRALVFETKEKNPDTNIGLTGMPIIENDEMQLSNDAMNKATILALFGVGVVFIAGFGSLRHPMLAMFVLLIAFAWTMGYITLAVGHLNILSISFGAMLIGLGTDFSVHYVARYLEIRKTVRSSEEALVQAAGDVGPGIMTGALTTSIAFYMAAFAEFTGIAELGIISGGGIIFCVLGTFVLLPALIQLFDAHRPSQVLPQPIDIRKPLFPTVRYPATTFVITTAGILFLFVGIPKLWYDHNLLNLQPEGVESVELERKLLDMEVDKGGKNVWYALSIADTREELLARKKEFAEKYPELTVEEIVSWFPGPDKEKIPIIESLAKRLEGLPERPPEIGVSEPDRVGTAIQRLQEMFFDPMSPVRIMGQQLAGQPLPPSVGNLSEQLQDIPRRLGEVRENLRRMSRSEYLPRTTQYQSAVAGDLLTRLRTLKSMAVVEPPTLHDLPDSLVERFVGKGGKHLMRIYSTANIWDMAEMEKYVSAVRSIDPKATGSPLQTYEASLQMLRGFKTAGLYAFFAVVAFLFVDFRNLKDVILSLLPMLAGLGAMFGILGWLDIPLNPANMIVLPLILGIGIDDGVHIIHEYRKQKGRFQLGPSTPTSILITTLTTIIGFGSMMIASHRGLQSLGRVLVIGVSACMFTSLVMLPAALTWWTWRRRSTVPLAASVSDALAPPTTVERHDQQLLAFPTFEDVRPLTVYLAAEEVEEELVSETLVFEPPLKRKRLTKRNVA